mgnify:FL=1
MNGWSRLGLMAAAAALVFPQFLAPTIKSVLDPRLKKIASQKPDAFIEGLHQRAYDRYGKLKSTLSATSLLDFGNRANAELVSPKFWIKRPPVTWYLQGNFGALTTDRKKLWLHRSVIAKRLEAGKSPWRLQSETLNWNQGIDLITSNTRTMMMHGSTTSVGGTLVINLYNNEYSLGEQVKTQWRSTPSLLSR